MIDAREYKTTESLKAAMLFEARAEIKSILRSKYDSMKSNLTLIGMYTGYLRSEYDSIKSNMIRISMCTGYDMHGVINELNRNDIYRYADEIEESARRIAKNASEIKALCRTIPIENENNE